MAGNGTSPDSGSDSFISEGLDFLRGENAGAGTTSEFVDPATLAGDDYERDEHGNPIIGVTGKPKRKRGRKSGGSFGSSGTTGAKSGKRNSQTVNALDTLSQTLMIVHMGIASFTKFDGFTLDKKESDALASSVANVMDQFDMTPDPRFTAVAGLVTTAGTIYGPRIYLYREQVKQKAKENKKEPPANSSVAFINPHLAG